MDVREPKAELANLVGQHCSAKASAVNADQAAALLKLLPQWELAGGKLARTFTFKDHYQTMAFVNAVAWVSHRQDHHPEMEVGYNRCRISYSTHSVGGLSENDFICAAKLDVIEKE